MKKNIIVSVESRKGGVGKTTAALCISKIFLEKGYAVLLIDTDITGTNIVHCADSPFWSDYINILTASENNKISIANLLSIFENGFMNGELIPSFKDSKINNFFNTDYSKINILGSQIYSQNGTPETICNPAVLFDQLHGYWFVDFLKEIIEDFATTIINKNIAVVLDNSPGYVGIAPAIQNWLTDIGPETGKFLMVTSLDSQDMQSCSKAISVLHEQYREKWNTSRMFMEAKDGDGDNLDYSLMKGGFFVRLTEHEESSGFRAKQFPVPYAFYCNKTKLGGEYSEHPEKYLGVIVNRVPKTVIKHRRTYKPELNRNDSPFLGLLGGHYSREWSKRMVGFDPYIEYQFLQSGMSKRRYGKKRNRNLERILRRGSNLFHDKDFFYLADRMSPKTFNQVNDYVKKFQDVIDIAIDSLRSNGLDYLADLIDEDWQPKNITTNFQATFYDFTTNASHNFSKDIHWDDLEDFKIMNEDRLFHFDEMINKIYSSFDESKYNKELMNVIYYLIASLPIPVGSRVSYDEQMIKFFTNIIDIELTFIKLEIYEHKNIDIPRLLSSDIRSKISKNESWQKAKFSNKLIHYEDDEFFDFFYAFTAAQARLLKLPEDSRFLIWLIRTMVDFENKKPDTFPYIKKIADDVILHKTLSYDAVIEKSSNALSESQYFVDFDKAIRYIVNSWEVEN